MISIAFIPNAASNFKYIQLNQQTGTAQVDEQYIGVIPCQINKEFWVTSRILTKLGVFVVHMVLTTHTNF